jgi:histidinol-phosphate aminotransferase
MHRLFSKEVENDFLARGFSRRSFGRLASLLAGGAGLSFYNEPALAQLSMLQGMPAGAVKINANENPLGPCPEALEAIARVAKNGGRYQYEETFTFARTLAEIEGVKPNYVLPFPGSSDPLHRVMLAYTSPAKSLVMGDPGYEAGERAARFIGAPVKKIPLRKDFSHDVKAMAAADPAAGVIYVCNPNNPTGTVTRREDIEWLVANKPAGSVLLLDEAYLHFTEEKAGTDLVAQDKDIIILRTFSKLYGMAGLRAGAAIGRPDLLEKIRSYGAGALPVTGMVAGTASLTCKDLVKTRRAEMKALREEQFAFCEKHKIKYIPSVSNKWMIDTGIPAAELNQKMAAEKVFIGRSWPSMPSYARVSIGTREEMAKFQQALLKVLGA